MTNPVILPVFNLCMLLLSSMTIVLHFSYSQSNWSSPSSNTTCQKLSRYVWSVRASAPWRICSKCSTLWVYPL